VGFLLPEKYLLFERSKKDTSVPKKIWRIRWVFAAREIYFIWKVQKKITLPRISEIFLSKKIFLKIFKKICGMLGPFK